LTEILVSIRFSEVAGHISYVQYQPHMEIEMSKIQAVRRTLSGASVEPILAALGEFVDVDELFHIASRHDGYREGGCLAGQAVSSAVQDLFFGGRGGVYNDVDCFAPAEGHHFDFTQGRNRVMTVQMAEVVGEIDYEQISARVVPRYRVLSSSRMEKLNLVKINEYARNKSIDLTASIIRSFDFNCVQVGIDLCERKLVWTPAFERFLASRQIEVESTHTPAHTAIRLAKKMRELKDVYVDQDRVFRTLAGAVMRLKVAEAHTARGKTQNDAMVESLARLGQVILVRRGVRSMASGASASFSLKRLGTTRRHCHRTFRFARKASPEGFSRWSPNGCQMSLFCALLHGVMSPNTLGSLRCFSGLTSRK
jgi:hypothetical protein